MSQIQGRVFDSSVYGWVADVAANFGVAGYATIIYVDASLVARDTLINQNITDIEDVSARVAANDSSIVILQSDVSSLNYDVSTLQANILITDISVAQNAADIEDVSARVYVNETSIYTIEASLNVATPDASYPDFYTAKQYIEDTAMAGRIYGGVITTNGDGTIDVSAGYGIVHSITASPTSYADDPGLTSPMQYVSWPDTVNIELQDNAYNYIYWNYDTGTIQATTDFYSIDFAREFTIGRAYRTGNDVVARLCGTNTWMFNRRVQLFGEEVFPVQRATGLVIGDAGDRKITSTAGIIWAELVNRFVIEAFDSSAGDTFTNWYHVAGVWDSSAGQTQVDNTNYDNGTGLATLGNNDFGVYYIYIVHDGTVHMVYGSESYNTQTDAEAVGTPSSLPGLLNSYATFCAKVIIKKSATQINEIQSAWDTVFQVGATEYHNDLSGLQGGAAGEYYHLTSAQSSDFVGKTYVDGSLSLRDTSINWLKDNALQTITLVGGKNGWLNGTGAGTNTIGMYTFEASSGIAMNFGFPAGVWYFGLDASLSLIKDISLGNIGVAQDGSALVYNSDGYWEYGVAGETADVTKAYVDGSLSLRDTSIAWLNLNKQNTIADGTYVKEASLGDTLYWEAGLLEASTGTTINTLDDIGDVSVSGATSGQVLAWKGTYWEPEDVSTAGVSFNYVDGSLSLRDTSIAYLNTNKANLNTSFTEVSTAYTVMSSDNNKVIKCDASLVITLPNNLSTGFQCTILNASTGYVKLDASILRTTDSSVQLRNLYAGASAVHYGSGTWYAWGNLKG